MIDVNVHLSHWPFRRLPGDELEALVDRLRLEGVTQAWSGSFDALLHKDLAAVNGRLAEACSRHADLLVPFGAVNPALPAWEEDLRRCHEQHKMPGIRLYPGYHGYDLKAPALAALLAAAAESGLVVQLYWRMEDARTVNSVLRLTTLEPGALPALIRAVPRLRLVLANALFELRAEALTPLIAAGEVFFDIATLEGAGGVGRLIAQIGSERVLFGSYYPFFVFGAARLKLDESALTADQREAITSGNARRLLARPAK